ncbi:MAG: hypothetical protein Q4G52_05605 [Clostridia bacterium]|nr:hypothetical protein [Clostridia bacterium]
MNDLKALDQLGTITDEMLAGLHADEAMRLRVKAVVQEGRSPRRRVRWTPVVCCAALALVCVGVGTSRLRSVQPAPFADPVQIENIAAGDGAVEGARTVADLGGGALVRKAAPTAESLFATADGDIPMVSVGGAVYRLLTQPGDVGASLRGERLGSVAAFAKEPSLASAEQMEAGISNIVPEGTEVYAVAGMDASTAVLAEVDGKMRLFQRVSYAGKGPGAQSLEKTFSVRGAVEKLELSGVGELSGEAANAAIGVLLDQAVLTSADQTASRQFLTVTLQNGLKLQLGVSGDTLCGCGGWSCPEFFEAFEAGQ